MLLGRPTAAALTVLAVLAACTSRPPTATPTVEPTAASPCAASLAAAHACTGAQLEVEMCSVFTAASVFSEITNNTAEDLVFDVGMTIVDPRGEERHAAVLGPAIRVPARSTSRSWQIAMPPLPDGYIRVEVMALGTNPAGDFERVTTSEGLLRASGGKVEVLDYHDWHQATSAMTVTEAPPP